MQMKTPPSLPVLDPEACCTDLKARPAFALFRALADPNRVALLCQLASCGAPCTVTELSACCPVDLSVVSRHLKALRESGVLTAERSGREVRYSVRVGALVAALRDLADALEACCPEPSQPAPRSTATAPETKE